MMTLDTSSKQNGWKETPEGSLIECRFRGRNISEQEKNPNEKHVPSILHLSENSNLFVRAQMFAFSYRYDQGRVKHQGRTINPEIAPTAELLHAQTFKLHASGKAKAQSKSVVVAASCWKLRTPKRTTCYR